MSIPQKIHVTRSGLEPETPSLKGKNIVELMTGKDNLLSAQQNQLQSKYQTVYNKQMLNLYAEGEIK